MKVIDSFQGEYRFLSNFWPVRVTLDEVVYPSVEHAYVAAKTLDLIARRDIPNMAAGAAKRYGGKIRIRSDWDEVRPHVMQDLVVQKFNDPELKQMLLSTGDATLIEGNTWGDQYWGMCNGVGQNNLGRLLMWVREGLK